MSIKSLVAGLAGAMVLVAMLPAQAVEITHDLGTTDVPDAPQRIVVLEYSFVDTLAAVGVSPVGIADDDKRDSIIPAYTAIIGDDWTSVGTRKSPSLEIIASLQPDLIIADTSRHEAVYEALSEIAPTISFDSLTGTYEVALEAAKTIAHAVGKDAEMEARLAEHTTKMEAYKAEVGDVSDWSAQFIIDNGEGIFLHSPVSYNGSLLAWFGFKSNMPSPDGHTYEEAIVNTSLEQLSEINPQIILRGKYTDPGLTDSWVGQPLYDNIEAVKNQHVYDVIAHEWSRLRGVLASEVSAANLVDIVKQLKQ
ncbi:iron complex transport system substrate-binding protein [Devosia sp. YR412]|uniref:ABC transporter substrate-binding protein n=1 Tax=Devosia sp. YR412 TaxID=1881030 RepID=UPI0008B5D389|nr:Fe(3+) dicitrate ABC transporter substrate-binding protein [Devosia sp. YR412]SEQ13141.1 iron complex transport system substrate-binding protein [Devosia sp. YR412]